MFCICHFGYVVLFKYLEFFSRYMRCHLQEMEMYLWMFLWILFYWRARLSDVSADALTLPMKERTKVQFGCDLLI